GRRDVRQFDLAHGAVLDHRHHRAKLLTIPFRKINSPQVSVGYCGTERDQGRIAGRGDAGTCDGGVAAKMD
ncbi:MAG TPA: hypothetical protein VLB05_16575, partial [Dongiaceae bacterium]|nr:hypothetical protein [Dongiaceae bacterium]